STRVRVPPPRTSAASPHTSRVVTTPAAKAPRGTSRTAEPAVARTVAAAAPTPAPEVMPMTLGSASGLPNRLWVTAPAVPSAAPTRSPAPIRGTRTFHSTPSEARAGASDSPRLRASPVTTSATGIGYWPRCIEATQTTSRATRSTAAHHQARRRPAAAVNRPARPGARGWAGAATCPGDRAPSNRPNGRASVLIGGSSRLVDRVRESSEHGQVARSEGEHRTVGHVHDPLGLPGRGLGDPGPLQQPLHTAGGVQPAGHGDDQLRVESDHRFGGRGSHIGQPGLGGSVDANDLLDQVV